MENKLALLEDKEYGTMGQALAPSSCADALPLPLRCRRGQLIVPAIFVIPSLFLFIILVFEITKLSREKIRHQFAVDSASFIEMTNYSDFLNRSAYINGAFPERIFAESFYGTCIPSKSVMGRENIYRGCGSRELFFMLWNNSAFPSRGDEINDSPVNWKPNEITANAAWQMYYANPDLKTEEPKFPPCELNSKSFDRCAYILTSDNALKWWIQWEDAMDVYKLYFQIYQLLGSVFEAQLAVFNRLTKDSSPMPHTFYRKSVWLNTGESGAPHDEYSRDAVQDSFTTKLDNDFKPRAACVENILFFGNQYTPTAYQPYKIYSPNEPAHVTPLSDKVCSDGAGLFQVAYAKGIKDMFNAAAQSVGGDLNVPSRHGIKVVQRWVAPKNYWDVTGSLSPRAARAR